MTRNGVTNPGFSKVSEINQKSIARNYLHLNRGKEYTCKIFEFKFKKLLTMTGIIFDG